MKKRTVYFSNAERTPLIPAQGDLQITLRIPRREDLAPTDNYDAMIARFFQAFIAMISGVKDRIVYLIISGGEPMTGHYLAGFPKLKRLQDLKLIRAYFLEIPNGFLQKFPHLKSLFIEASNFLTPPDLSSCRELRVLFVLETYFACLFPLGSVSQLSKLYSFTYGQAGPEKHKENGTPFDALAKNLQDLKGLWIALEILRRKASNIPLFTPDGWGYVRKVDGQRQVNSSVLDPLDGADELLNRLKRLITSDFDWCLHIQQFDDRIKAVIAGLPNVWTVYLNAELYRQFQDAIAFCENILKDPTVQSLIEEIESDADATQTATDDDDDDFDSDDDSSDDSQTTTDDDDDDDDDDSDSEADDSQDPPKLSDHKATLLGAPASSILRARTADDDDAKLEERSDLKKQC